MSYIGNDATDKTISLLNTKMRTKANIDSTKEVSIQNVKDIFNDTMYGHKHRWDTQVGVAIEPTCTQSGQITWKCRCGETTIQYTDPLEHDFPTPHSQCTRCGKYSFTDCCKVDSIYKAYTGNQMSLDEINVFNEVNFESLPKDEYTIQYSDNCIDTGVHGIYIISTEKNYTAGTIVGYITITKAGIMDSDITIDVDKDTFTVNELESGVRPNVTVHHNDRLLVEGTDYQIREKVDGTWDNMNWSEQEGKTLMFRVEGIGNYQDTKPCPMFIKSSLAGI